MKKFISITLLLLTALTLAFYSCQKDNLLVESSELNQMKALPRSGTPITKDEARTWFSTTYGLSKTIDLPGAMSDLTVKPIWAFAKAGTAWDNTPVVVCPIQDIPEIHEDSLTRAFLVFSRGADATGIVPNLVLCRAFDGSVPDGLPTNNASFSGLISVLDFKGSLYKYMLVEENGQLIGGLEQAPLNEQGLVILDMEEVFDDGANVYLNIEGGIKYLNLNTEPFIMINLPNFGGFNMDPNYFGNWVNPNGFVNPQGPINVLEFHEIVNPLHKIDEYLGDAYNTSWISLAVPNRNLVASNEWLIDVINDFVTTNNFKPAAWSFVNTFLPLLQQYDLTFVTVSDLQLLFENPDVYAHFKDFLEQNPNATMEDKIAALRMVVLAPSNPILNLSERIECFDAENKNINNTVLLSVTLYVDQTVSNTNKILDDRVGMSEKANIGAGHTWLGITQQTNTETTTLNVGLYPQNKLLSGSFNPVAGAFNDDESHHWDVSVTWTWTPGAHPNGFQFLDFYNLIDQLGTMSIPPQYDLNDFNCTTWAVTQLSHLGISDLPLNQVKFPYVNEWGLAPGQLGQDLRNSQPQNSSETAYQAEDTGQAPASTCKD